MMKKNVKSEKRMTSREIAVDAKKQHKHVMESIRNMEAAWEKVNGSRFRLVEYIDSKGERRPEYHLTKTECLYIATKFSDEARARLILRWEELETERLEEEKNPDLAISRGVDNYKKQGRPEDWISHRIQGIATRNGFTKVLQEHGVNGKGYADATNAIYAPIFGGEANLIRQKKGLQKGENIRDNLSKIELAAVNYAEQLAAMSIEDKNLFGNIPCVSEAGRASTTIIEATRSFLKS